MSTSSGIQFDINKIARVDVGSQTAPQIRNETDAQFWNNFPSIFDDYVNRVATLGDQGNVSVGRYTGNSQTQRNLAKASNPNLGINEFEDTAAELAVRLNDDMQNAGGSAGTLFVAQVAFDGPNVLNGPNSQAGRVDSAVLFKMDTEVVQRLFKNNGNIDQINEGDVYPDASNIQKSAIFPLFNTPTFSRSGDVKIYEKTYSNYFRRFLQCEDVDSSLSQFNNLSGIISELRTQDGTGLVRQQDMTSLKNLANWTGGQLTRNDIESYLDSITSNSVPLTQIRSELDNEGVEEIGTANATTPEKFKYDIGTGGDNISLKVPIDEDGQVNVQNQGGQVTITIQGNSVSKDTTGK
jgi:hypothetical protein